MKYFMVMSLILLIQNTSMAANRTAKNVKAILPAVSTPLMQSESLFTTQVPATLANTDGPSINYELGMKFSSTSAGTITAIRFYKSSLESGTHTGKIYSTSGSLLASVIFSGETASGWQVQALKTPLSITANSVYVVSVNTSNSYYVATSNAFGTQIINGHLKSVVGNNGVFGSVGAMPASSWQNSNYFRDVVFAFSTIAADTTPPTITITNPLAASTNAGSIKPAATASDNVGVAGVQFKMNNVNVGAEILAAPYALTLDTTQYANGTYTLSAVARDAAANKTTAQISMTINNVVTANNLRYVSPTGNDSNAGNSLSAAWKTIQHAASTAVAGDIVTIQPGTYNESVTFNKSGTSTKPITFIGSATQACAKGNLKGLCPTSVITGNITINSDYVTLDTLKISPKFAISDSVYGTLLAGNYDKIINSLFTNFGAAAGDQATMVVFNGSFNTVLNSTLRDQNDIDVFHVWGHDQKIVGNYVTNIQELNYELNHTDFVQTWLYTSFNILIDSNVVTNSTCQLGNTETDGSTGDHDWTISNNVFANITNPFFSGIPNTRFLNNFFYKVGTNDNYPISFYTNTEPGNQRSSAGSDVSNNVFVSSGELATNGGPMASQSNNLFVTVNPGYIDLATGAEISAVPLTYLNKGTNESLFITKDKVGVSRPATGAWTIGPYQN